MLTYACISNIMILSNRKEEIKMKQEITYKVLEGNNGALFLIIYKGEDIIYFHDDYEYSKGQLIEDISNIYTTDISDWDGNRMNECDMEEFDNEMELGWLEVIADEKGIYPDKMGLSGKREFDIED